MFFTIANDLLTLNTRATDLRITPQAIVVGAWNNFENLKDGSSGIRHPERCSYVILDNPLEDKWGVVVKAWVNRILSKTKVCLG